MQPERRKRTVKTAWIHVRITPAEAAQLRQAAQQHGINVSALARTRLLQASA